MTANSCHNRASPTSIDSMKTTVKKIIPFVTDKHILPVGCFRNKRESLDTSISTGKILFQYDPAEFSWCLNNDQEDKEIKARLWLQTYVWDIPRHRFRTVDHMLTVYFAIVSLHTMMSRKTLLHKYLTIMRAIAKS
jgi:hypothetical protein